MSKKGFKKLMQHNRVVAIPSRKRENKDGSMTQLYNIVPVEMLSLYE